MKLCSLLPQKYIFHNKFFAKQDYADKVLEKLDPEKKLIKHRMYRDSCRFIGGTYVKDLNVLERDMKKTLIVDNMLDAFAYHVIFFFDKLNKVTNGVLIKSFMGEKTDSALIHLLPELINLENAEDVRDALKSYYRC